MYIMYSGISVFIIRLYSHIDLKYVCIYSYTCTCTSIHCAYLICSLYIHTCTYISSLSQSPLFYLLPLSPPYLLSPSPSPSPLLSLTSSHPLPPSFSQALWRTLHNPDDSVAAVAYRVLGKFGGSNRKMISTPQPVSNQHRAGLPTLMIT